MIEYPDELPADWVLLAKYEAACDRCAAKFKFGPSLDMQYARANLGFGSCPQCGALLELYINHANDGGLTRRFEGE